MSSIKRSLCTYISSRPPPPAAPITFPVHPSPSLPQTSVLHPPSAPHRDPNKRERTSAPSILPLQNVKSLSLSGKAEIPAGAPIMSAISSDESLRVGEESVLRAGARSLLLRRASSFSLCEDSEEETGEEGGRRGRTALRRSRRTTPLSLLGPFLK